MHLRGILLLIWLLLGAAGRSIRIANSHHYAQQQTNTVTEALVPRRVLQAGFFRPQHGQPASVRDGEHTALQRLPEPSYNRSRSPLALRDGARRATVALKAAGGPQEDQVLPKDDLPIISWQERLDQALLDIGIEAPERIKLWHLAEDAQAALGTFAKEDFARGFLNLLNTAGSSSTRRALCLSLMLSLTMGKEVWALPLMVAQREGSTPVSATGAVPAALGRSIGEPVVSGGRLPLTVGYGTCLIPASGTELRVRNALDAGYRLFDTAQRYGNEAGVGTAIKSGISSGKLKRKDVFVTTKVWVDNMGYASTLDSVRQSADKLGNLDGGIDLVLMHWPGEFVSKDDPAERARTLNGGGNARLRKDTWSALEKLRRDGVVKQIGVANFDKRHLKELLEYAEVKPAVNQVEVHPFNQRTQLIDLCQSEGIPVEAYSPLGGKGNQRQVTDELFENTLLKEIAVAHAKTVPEVILRWHLQRGITPIPKSSTPARMRENFDVFDFELTKEEMAAIVKLDRGQFAIFDADLLA